MCGFNFLFWHWPNLDSKIGKWSLCDERFSAVSYHERSCLLSGNKSWLWEFLLWSLPVFYRSTYLIGKSTTLQNSAKLPMGNFKSYKMQTVQRHYFENASNDMIFLLLRFYIIMYITTLQWCASSSRVTSLEINHTFLHNADQPAISGNGRMCLKCWNNAWLVKKIR